MKTQSCQTRLLLIVLLFLLGLFTLPVQAQESGSGTITLFVYPPSDRIDYSRPGALMWRTVVVELKRVLISRRRVPFYSRFDGSQKLKAPYLSTIGHTICLIDCTLPDGAAYAHWASLSGKSYTPTALRLLVKEHAGFGVLLRDYEGGMILGEDENLQRLIWYRGPEEQEGRASPRYIQFPVQPDQCADIKEMVDFFEQFHPDSGLMAPAPDLSKEERMLYFTNMIDPLESYLNRKQSGHGVMGGGCAPFAVALLKTGRLYDPALDAYWKRSFTISERLIGQPGVKKVPFLSVLLGQRGRSWVHEGYDNRRLQLYDPSMIWQFIVNIENGLVPAPGSGTAAIRTNSPAGQMHPAGFLVRQGPPIGLPVPEYIPHRKYPKRPGRKMVQGIVWEVKSEK